MPVQLKEDKSKHATATAGPSEDDRYGAGPVASNLEGRIIKVDVVGGRTRIMIARGTSHGVHPGMEGSIKSGDGLLAHFQIESVTANAAFAFVDTTPDQLGDKRVVINGIAAAKPAPASSRARIIHVEVMGKHTMITIARGTEHGITRGMKGRLVDEGGREGLEIKIEGIDARKSYAWIDAPVDEVHRHIYVDLAPPQSQKPVQRRVSGTASTADVQSTANAGVASASSRLPHFDTIQRAFGKHDISGIQAQVGGAATVASESLGASAYATGNKIAFASSPDLHTAAHEAAHTIQQRHGAVGFQGLGAADDEHEHHADAVADAVVAGESAEPLLDKLVGGSSSHAVQRKEVTLSERGRTRLDSLRAILTLIETEIGKRSPEGANALVFETKRHLGNALSILNESGGDLERVQLQQLRDRMRETSHSLQQLRSAARPATSLEANTLSELTRIETTIISSLGPDVLAPVDDRLVSPEATPDLVTSVLELIRTETATIYPRLTDSSKRESILAQFNSSTLRNLLLVREALAKADPKQLASRIEQTSGELLKLRRWAFGRDTRGRLLSLLGPALTELDVLRGSAGLRAVVQEDAPRITERDYESETVEQSNLKSSADRFEAAIVTSTKLFDLGVQRFETFAALKRPAAPRDGFKDLLFQVLAKVALNVAAPGIGTCVSAFVAGGFLSEAAGDNVTKSATKELNGQVEKKIKAILGSSSEHADSNEMVRERKYFVEGVIGGNAIAIEDLRNEITDLIQRGQVSASELDGITATLKAKSAVLIEHAYQEAAHGFAMLQTKKGFAHADERDRMKSDDAMAGYLDKNERGAPRKLGTMGVARLDMRITQHGDELKATFNQFQLHGMNDDMADAVLARANNQLDKLGLPIEVEIRPPAWAVRNWIDLPFLVIDETGSPRFARNWEAITEAFANKDWKQPRDAKLIKTPQTTWDTIRNAHIDAAIVLRTKPVG